MPIVIQCISGVHNASESTSALHYSRIHTCVYNAQGFKFASNLHPQHITIYICVTIPRNSHLHLQWIRIDNCIYNASESTFASQLTFASTTHQDWHFYLQHIIRRYLARLLVMVRSQDSSLSSNVQISSAISLWQPYLAASHISLTAISRWYLTDSHISLMLYLVNSHISLIPIFR